MHELNAVCRIEGIEHNGVTVVILLFKAFQLHNDEFCRIPDLVDQLAGIFHFFLRINDVIAQGTAGGPEADSIGRELVDHFSRL